MTSVAKSNKSTSTLYLTDSWITHDTAAHPPTSLNMIFPWLQDDTPLAFLLLLWPFFATSFSLLPLMLVPLSMLT